MLNTQAPERADLTSAVPARDELVRRAAELVPVLRANSEWSEQNRALPEESLTALADAGVFKMRVPKRYGGYESDAGTLLGVMSEIAQGDGSAAWCVSAWTISTWLACLFPDHVQDQVFATENTRVCGVLSPTAEAKPVEGGVVVNGAWHFISGARHSLWQVIIAMAPTPDGASMWPVMAVVPLSDLQIVDDWNTMGLRGTGSVTTVAQDVFVPADRVLPMVAVLQEQFASQLNANSPVYRSPMMATGCTTFTGTAIGLAKAARSAFMDRIDRKITYTDYTSQREAPLTHLELAEASFKIEESELRAAALAAQMDDKCLKGEPWTLEEKVHARAHLGRVFQLCKESAEILSSASGGSSIYTTEPLQRIVRDLHALSMHSLMHSSTNTELYGRILCGLPPNTMYL
ncbi:MAG TPA: acyl-CoA dehydrogenase family protein [Jatrophihabitans sp.]|nr:acyl-CoA dehydrogenase family protein [Jatrophihabitans sp.]